MIGRNHLITNTGSVAILTTGVLVGRELDPSTKFVEYIRPVSEFIYSTMITPKVLPFFIFVAVSVLFFYLGTLLPDIDSEKSLLGRYFHLPIEHRTWTHAIWLPLIFIGLGSFFSPFYWLSLGYLLHLFWDNLSVGGVCFFYPISNYRRYGGGAKVKRKHILRLYGVGSPVETIIVILVVLLSIFTVYKGYLFLS